MVLIMAGMYIYQRFLEPHFKEIAVSNTAVQKDDDKTASMEYSGYITVDTSTDSIKMYFKNPEKSSKKMSLEIVGHIDGEDITFAKIEGIEPGEEVKEIDYENAHNLKKGKYKGNFILHFYGDSGTEEIVNSKVVIDVIIK